MAGFVRASDRRKLLIYPEKLNFIRQLTISNTVNARIVNKSVFLLVLSNLTQSKFKDNTLSVKYEYPQV